jgi:broad specificity phosphatase PhoE
MASIRTAGLTKDFGDLRAVNAINLDLPEGGVAGFVGPNGAGKSTTIRMLLGLIAPTDGQLSEQGMALAAELGRRRRNDGVAAVFSSDLGRAVQTVEVAFGGSGIPVHLDARLRECDYGVWNGMPVSRLERERVRRVSQPFPGEESYLQVVGRVAGFLEELACDVDGARVLVVGHSATRWALDYLLAGAALAELLVAPFDWQEGWAYALPAGWQRPPLAVG